MHDFDKWLNTLSNAEFIVFMALFIIGISICFFLLAGLFTLIERLVSNAFHGKRHGRLE